MHCPPIPIVIGMAKVGVNVRINNKKHLPIKIRVEPMIIA